MHPSRLLPLLVLLYIVTPAPAQDQPAGRKETVTFDGQTLTLAYEAGKSPGEHIKEYIPEGQTLDSWKLLASIHEYPQSADPEAFAAAIVRALEKQTPGAPSRVIRNPGTGDVILDFVTWDENGAFGEFNVFRIAKRPGGGLIARQYAVRDYQDVRAFLKNLGPLRTRLVNLMAKDGLKVNN